MGAASNFCKKYWANQVQFLGAGSPAIFSGHFQNSENSLENAAGEPAGTADKAHGFRPIHVYQSVLSQAPFFLLAPILLLHSRLFSFLRGPSPHDMRFTLPFVIGTHWGIQVIVLGRLSSTHTARLSTPHIVGICSQTGSVQNCLFWEQKCQQVWDSCVECKARQQTRSVWAPPYCSTGVALLLRLFLRNSCPIAPPISAYLWSNGATPAELGGGVSHWVRSFAQCQHTHPFTTV